MLEYCTWLTNAAGDKQGSLSLRSHSMAIFLDLSPKYSSQIQNEWEFSCIAQQMQTFPLKCIKSFAGFSRRQKFVYPKCLGLFASSWFLSMLCLSKAQHKLENVAACSSLHLLYVPPYPMKTKQFSARVESFFQRIISNKTEEQNVLLFHLLLWRISPHLWPLSKVETFGCTPSCF